MLKKINETMLKGNFLSVVIKYSNRKFQTRAYKRFAKKIKVEKNKILFATFQGRYTCNLKYIAEEILRRKLDVQIVWVVPKLTYQNLDYRLEFPNQIKLVKSGTMEYYEEAASSRIWIDNALTLEYANLTKKKNQFLIQTWHGSMGIKRMGAEDQDNKYWVKKAFRYGKKTDLLVSNSDFETNVYKETYWPKTKVLEVGHPRNDILFQKPDSFKRKVLESYELPKNKNIFMYAPTFRDDGLTFINEIDYTELKKVLEKKFGGEWIIFLRMHFKDRKKVQLTEKLKKFVFDVSDYADMQELIAAADIGMTDYSSWIYDWVLTKKLGLLFVPDMDEYISERNFYYPLTETPFPIAKTCQELIKNIKNLDKNKFVKESEEFIERKGSKENGEASKKVVDFIEEMLKKEM